MTEFEKGYEQGYKDGIAGAALPNVNDNGDKIDGYNYAYKTDSRGEPYIHIDSVRSMLKKAADVQPVNQWISVEDRLPENDRDVLVYDKVSGMWIAQYDNRWETEEFILDDVTHWQPLPELPKEVNNG